MEMWLTVILDYKLRNELHYGVFNTLSIRMGTVLQSLIFIYSHGILNRYWKSADAIVDKPAQKRNRMGIIFLVFTCYHNF